MYYALEVAKISAEGVGVLERGLEAFGVAPAARHALRVYLDQLAVLILALVAQEHPSVVAPRAPAATVTSSGYRGSVDVPARDAGRAAVESEVLAVAALGLEVYLMKAAARGRDRPQLALEVVDAAGVVGEHPARRALDDGLPDGFSGGGVPGIG